MSKDHDDELLNFHVNEIQVNEPEEIENISNAEKAILHLISINWFFNNWNAISEASQDLIIKGLKKKIG